MSHSQPVYHKAQTLRQAKAAYKARGQPTLTDAQRRQLERSVELDRRAWRIKEGERRRAETARRKMEKEAKEREDKRRVLGSQRRCDRFGFLSSQMHLGAWYAGKIEHIGSIGEMKGVPEEKEDQDDFSDEGVDDEMLVMGAFDVVGLQTAMKGATLAMTGHCIDGEVQTISDESLDSFLLELDSSTQIARELEMEDGPARAGQEFVPRICADNTDFDTDLDLSDTDLALIESVPPARRSNQDKNLMPPPFLPASRILQNMTGQRTAPPSLSFLTSESSTGTDGVGFTLAELETFVDDDLQLTQAGAN